MLHGAIFLFPVALATLSQPGDDATHDLARGWLAVFAIEILLYVVGTAFIVLILAKDRTMHAYKMAAATDPLTGLLNRRGFFEAAKSVMWRHRGHPTPIAAVCRGGATNHRSSDVIGRLGGEEFVALLPGTLADTARAAERVRLAFAAASVAANGRHVAGTVSVGVACGSPLSAIDLLISRADTALYRAKTNGRDRVEITLEKADSAAEQRHDGQGGTIQRCRREKEKSAATGDALESCVV